MMSTISSLLVPTLSFRKQHLVRKEMSQPLEVNSVRV
jgi:hypothetical protein